VVEDRGGATGATRAGTAGQRRPSVHRSGALGSFSRFHMGLGKTTFVGACLFSASGAVMYALLYVV
jgi:hypothetical protein